MLKRFLKNCDGGAAPLLALAALPILGAVGASIDYSRAASVRTSMQGALDATALMLSRNASSIPGADLNSKATALFNAEFKHPENLGVQLSATGAAANTTYTVTLTATSASTTKFMGVMGFQTINVTARTTARYSYDGLGCVLALDPTISSSAAGQGSTNVALKGCSLYANSNAAAAVSVDGSGRVEAYSVHAVGGVSGQSNITTETGIHEHSGALTDPYADVNYPAFFGCTEQNFRAHSEITINPGVYCGGIAVNAGAVLTLNPGIYYLDGGDLTVNGGATMQGTGVTLVFTSKNKAGYANATINGNANVSLTAPKTGPMAGIVIFGDRAMPNTTAFTLNGGSMQYFGGAVYTPSGVLSFSGGAATGTSCTQLIARRVNFTGNSSIAINCANQGTRPFSVAVNRLVS
jgi:Flp pilus assembly protein TadG